MKRVLVTAGATTVPIDQVRSISNIFKGRTGTNIAEHFYRQGCKVTILTSNPELVSFNAGVDIMEFRTFDQLMNSMQQLITGQLGESFDIVIHSAAVSDYKVDSVYVENENGKMKKICSDKKISSDHEKIFLGLIKTPKIVDLIKNEWRFKGVLVKFKLQVGISDEELLSIAEKSMIDSSSDFIVANCLEWASKRAYILGLDDDLVEWVKREDLPRKLYRRFVK